jgi:IrrE N-terminal-like domain
MPGEVPDADAIRKATERLLRKAEAIGRLPTPVQDIIAAADLVEPEHSMLSDFVLDQAPEHLRRAIRKLRFKVRAVLDRRAREVHVDPSIQHRGRLAFKKLHEVTHDILPWQRALGYADDDATLSWATKQLFERQANQGAAELLFQRDMFSDMARQYVTGMASIIELADLFGVSVHATFRRFVETHLPAVAGVVMELSPCTAHPIAYRRKEVVCSERWAQRLGSSRSWPLILRSPPYSFIDLAPRARSTRSVVPGDLLLPDVNNEPVRLNVEVYCNSYMLFVLMWQPRNERLRHRRIIVPGVIGR